MVDLAAAKMVDPARGRSPECPLLVVCLMDGLPVDKISITQWCVCLAPMKPEFSDQSEALLRCFSITGQGESNAKFHRTLSENHLGEDLTELVTTQRIDVAGETRHVLQLFSADKKAQECGRGCSQGCPHCMCPLDNRLKLPWPVATPPQNWDAADALCADVCVHRLPDNDLLLEAAHELEPGSFCRFCNCVPYQTEEERSAARAKMKALSELTTKAGKREYAKLVKKHTETHGKQKEFQKPIASAGMARWVPELLHYGDLNAGKQVFFKTTLNLSTRTTASGSQDSSRAWGHQLTPSPRRTAATRTRSGGRDTSTTSLSWVLAAPQVECRLGCLLCCIF